MKDEVKSRLYADFMEQLRETTQVEQDFPVKLKLQHELAKLEVGLLLHKSINSLYVQGVV